LKKSTGSVLFGFGFISLKPKKPNRTEPNPNRKTEPNRKKPSQTGLNLFLSNKTKPFEPVLFFLKF
jgi:hypothetical protein